MDNNKNSNENKPSFDENQAYEELRFIFQIAIENQDFEFLKEKIAIWESRYPLAEFTDTEIIRRIKTILNKDFLTRIIGDYLASQILHEKEKQKEAYLELKSIIDTAKSNGDFKTAQKKVSKWKTDLAQKELSLATFDRYYKSKVLTLLLVPTQEIENQEEATKEIKDLNSRKGSMDSEAYAKELSAWQNKYPLNKFPEKLKEELNALTLEALNSISQKANFESASKELEELIASPNNNEKPLDLVSSILSKYNYDSFDDDSKSQINILTTKYLAIEFPTPLEIAEDIPTVDLATTTFQLGAINSLKDILGKSGTDTDAILNWIYQNRKVNFSQFAREEIVKYFASAGYKVPTQETYTIPEVSSNLAYSEFNKIDEIRQNVILNYLGIVAKGDTLSTSEKGNVEKAYSSSLVSSTMAEKKPIVLPVFDNEPDLSNQAVEEINNTEPQSTESSEIIADIIIEDLLVAPEITYSLVVPDKKDLNSRTNCFEDALPIQDTSNKSSVETTLDGSLEAATNTKSNNENPESTVVPSLLTPEDEHNIEKANELSSYVVVAMPILDAVYSKQKHKSFSPVKEVSSQKQRI